MVETSPVEAAKSAGRTKTYLGAQYQRLARRIGANRAAMAVAHSIIAYCRHQNRAALDLGIIRCSGFPLPAGMTGDNRKTLL